MPHIKVKPFDTDMIEMHLEKDERFVFRALSQKNSDELLGLYYEGDAFVLQIKKREDAYLIKPDSISRPLDVNRIKRALALMTEILELTVLHSNIALSVNKPSLADRANKKIKDFENPEFSKEKIAIEVGFGSGRHLLYQAKKHPDTLFIGIEIHTPSAQQVLKQIAIQGLENIWIVNYDARLLLEMMPSNSCSDIYVHFPVPWDKKPHRRVIGPSFLQESMRVLHVDGRLELRTDSDQYYHYALETFSAYPKIHFHVEKNSDIAVTSKYEDRWRAQEKDIYTMTVVCMEHSESKMMDYDFTFDRQKSKEMTAEICTLKTAVYERFFIHFEECFVMQGEKGMLVKVSFGSFDRPEQKYLFLAQHDISYYPQDPVKTETNYHAHQQIGEFIYG